MPSCVLIHRGLKKDPHRMHVSHMICLCGKTTTPFGYRDLLRTCVYEGSNPLSSEAHISGMGGSGVSTNLLSIRKGNTVPELLSLLPCHVLWATPERLTLRRVFLEIRDICFVIAEPIVGRELMVEVVGSTLLICD